MERTFGIEIEFNGITASEAVIAVRSAGVDCINMSRRYHDDNFNNWKVKYDISVNRFGCGSGALGGNELVSPILKGQNGLLEAAKVARALELAGAKIDRTCGLHVHVQVDDLNRKAMKNLVRGWVRYEKVTDLFMPMSRRDSNNQYCKSLLALAIYPRLNTENELFDYLDNGSRDTFAAIYNLASDRYGKLNAAALSSRGTVEFRGHSGTVDWKKITKWIQFCILFVDTFSVKRTNSSNRPCVHRWLTVGVSDLFNKMQSVDMEVGTELRRFYQKRIKSLKRNTRRANRLAS